MMLDRRFNAHRGDSSVARLIDHEKAEKTTITAPELFSTGEATKETDVYSFGVLILEVVSGRKRLNMNAVTSNSD